MIVFCLCKMMWCLVCGCCCGVVCHHVCYVVVQREKAQPKEKEKERGQEIVVVLQWSLDSKRNDKTEPKTQTHNKRVINDGKASCSYIQTSRIVAQ